MATLYSEVFKSFTSKITDYQLGSLEDIVVENDMISLLNSSIVYFRLPKIDIFNKDDKKQIFNEDLSYEEIEVLSTLMVAEWFKRIIYNTDVLVQKYGETDFEFKSQANQLKALAEGYKEVVDRDIKRKIGNYSRTYQGKIFNYKLLAGKNK